MTFAEQLNSMVRFAIYFSTFVFIVKRDANIFLVPLFAAGFTYSLYSVDSKNKQREKFHLEERSLDRDRVTKKVCAKPTKENPFMNVLISDYAENPTRKPACDVTRGKTRKEIKKAFENNLYRDVSDVYDKIASDRNYYTTPSTTIPNDQAAFANFLYGQSKSCKEGSGLQCYKNLYRPIAQ